MNKQQLIETVAKEAKLTKADAKRALEAFIDTVHRSLKKGDSVRLIGFGTFTVKKRKARKGINPQTKQVINIKARRVPAFIAGAELKKYI
jgi:DNA-binding protein HU-beta